MTTSAVKITTELHADELRRVLKNLPPRVQQSVLRKGMRRGLKPLQDALRAEWAAANYRGKPRHRRAIVSAHRTDVRRRGAGNSARVMGRVGVMYGMKGGAAARGRQRVWHLLESGFRRFLNRSAYSNYSIAVRPERDAYRQFIKHNRSSIMAEGLPKQMRREALQQMYAAARVQFGGFSTEREVRRTVRRKSGLSVVVGSNRSKKVVSSRMKDTLRRVRDEIIAAAKAALRRSPYGNR